MLSSIERVSHTSIQRDAALVYGGPDETRRVEQRSAAICASGVRSVCGVVLNSSSCGHMQGQRHKAHVDRAAEETRRLVRKAKKQFYHVDLDTSGDLSFEEFVLTLPTQFVSQRSRDELKQLFDLVDVDGNGRVSKQEFFLSTLSQSAKMTGSGLDAVFRKYEKALDHSSRQHGGGGLDTMDVLEFRCLCDDMGFLDIADSLAAELPKDGHGHILIQRFMDMIRNRTSASADMSELMKSFLVALSVEAHHPVCTGSGRALRIDTTGFSFTGRDPEEARLNLEKMLEKQPLSLTTILRTSCERSTISIMEFVTTFETTLGFQGPKFVVHEIYDQIDADQSGRVAMEEVSAWLRGEMSEVAKRRNAMMSMTFKDLEKARASAEAAFEDASCRGSCVRQPPTDAEKRWGAESFRAQIRRLLLERGLDASDWVRAWDAEGDDRLAKREFLRNMEHFVGDGQLWHTHMKAVAQEAFDQIDTDRGGVISLSELKHWLGDTRMVTIGAAGELEMVKFDVANPLAPQLREALQRNAVRVIDLFRAWDANGDGKISRHEFHRAMPLLGVELPPKVIDDLFDNYDPDKSGWMEFVELKKMLKPTPPSALKKWATSRSCEAASAPAAASSAPAVASALATFSAAGALSSPRSERPSSARSAVYPKFFGDQRIAPIVPMYAPEAFSTATPTAASTAAHPELGGTLETAPPRARSRSARHAPPTLLDARPSRRSQPRLATSAERAPGAHHGAPFQHLSARANGKALPSALEQGVRSSADPVVSAVVSAPFRGGAFVGALGNAPVLGLLCRCRPLALSADAAAPGAIAAASAEAAAMSNGRWRANGRTHTRPSMHPSRSPRAQITRDLGLASSRDTRRADETAYHGPAAAEPMTTARPARVARVASSASDSWPNRMAVRCLTSHTTVGRGGVPTAHWANLPGDSGLKPWIGVGAASPR